MDTSDDPMTLLLVGTGVGALGQIQAGRAAEAEAESAQNIANYNAAVMEQEAKAIRQKAGFEQQRQAKKAARIRSTMQARIGVAGAVPSVGAPLLAMAEQEAELELENLLIGYEGEVAAQRALSQAELDRMGGRLAVQRGVAAKQASYFGAGATLLTGFGAAGMGGGGGDTTSKIGSILKGKLSRKYGA